MKKNKQKQSQSSDISELWSGQSIELLKQLHLVTADGKINADTRRKLKQVYHLVQFIEPLIRGLFARKNAPLLVDVGAGKSYLGFILYDLILRHHSAGQIISIEAREELVQNCLKLAQKEGFERMDFFAATLEEATQDPRWKNSPPDLICALHACDTATDDAIRFGLEHQAEKIVLVPCCQAEVSRQLEGKSPSSIMGLWRFPLHRREFGSHLTNVIRALFLESKGYKVTVTELTGWEHSLKNELIIAEKTGQLNQRSQEQLQYLINETGVSPKLLRE